MEVWLFRTSSYLAQDKAVFPTAPLNSEFLSQIVGTKPNDSPLGQVWSKYGSSDIEVLLTRFDLDLLTGKSEFVRQFRFKQDVEWLRPLTRLIADNDVIISLNYDCFLEGFLDFHAAWSPKGGYNTIDSAPWDDSLPDNPHDIRILKIHGSESFRRSSFYNKPKTLTVGLKINEALFPRSGKKLHFGCRPDDGAYVIAPSFANNSTWNSNICFYTLYASRELRNT
jgi:hypothetical protein